MSTPRILAIMGSGETAPTMVQTHRHLVAGLGGNPRAVVIDTPYGFQENAGELADRAVQYFSESIDVDLAVAGLTRLDHDDPLRTEHGLDRLRAADYVFAGPGSPTYALAQWHGGPVPGLLAAKLEQGGIVVFASAAALTLGAVTVPVYEIRCRSSWCGGRWRTWRMRSRRACGRWGCSGSCWGWGNRGTSWPRSRP